MDIILNRKMVCAVSFIFKGNDIVSEITWFCIKLAFSQNLVRTDQNLFT